MKICSFKKILNKINKKNIAIIGQMGTGKSVFGKKIASFFQVEHIDTDKKIVKFENATINDIFSKKGQSYFRNIESKIILKVLNEEKVVISLGGGSILKKEIRDAIRKHSFSIFLDTKLMDLNKRLNKSKNRPLLKKGNLLTILKRLDEERRQHYLKADICIDNSLSLNNAFSTFIEKFSSFDA